MERGKTRGRPNTRITCRIYVELSDELDERDAFAWDHLPEQQKGMHLHWTCVLDTGDRKAAPTLPRFPVGRTTYEKYKEFVSKTAPQLKLGASQGKRNLPSRRQRSWRHSIAEYRGGDSIAEGTVPRRQQYSVTAVGARAGEYRGLHDPEISCSHAASGAWRAEPGDRDLIAGLHVRPQAKRSYHGYEATLEEAVVIHIQHFFASKARNDSLE